MTKIFMCICPQIEHSLKSSHQECPDFYHIHSRHNINLKTNIGFLRCLNVSSIRIMNCACERITNSGYLNANAVFTSQQYHYSGKIFSYCRKMSFRQQTIQYFWHENVISHSHTG